MNFNGSPVTPPQPQSEPPGSGLPQAQPYPQDNRFDLGPRAWAVFGILFFATVCTTWMEGGPWFALSLILILTAHEFGHYFACVKNNVDASLPNFIPGPFVFMAGTLGAFIRIKEPIPNRKALMEIGASGPLAGFVVAVPVWIIGIMLSEVSLAVPEQGGFSLGDSVITLTLAEWILNIGSLEEVSVMIHPIAYAGWFGFFFTAMNLLPMGQLDGGHVLYALYGERHVLWARFFFLVLLGMGFLWPGWFVFAALVLIVGLKHPPLVEEQDDLAPQHFWMGYGCVAILALTFIPVPIVMS